MTNRILPLLLMVLIIQSCDPKSEDKSENQVELVDTATEAKPELMPDSISSKKSEAVSGDTCRCEWKAAKFNHYADLTFSNNGKPFNLDSLAKWTDNPERLKIKSLRLIDFETIPPEMAIFENVESVYLEAINHHNVQGLEVFPGLRMLKAEEERFEINDDTKWIQKIEVIHANKTKFSGLGSFNQMPHLREMKLCFSGFDTFPSDFENLKCLGYFQTGAHTFGEIDLRELDFTGMPCLKYCEFHSWRKNIKGIPNGIKNVKTVKISHPNLTETEKEELKKSMFSAL